jgi:hypothetical protein
MATTISTAVPVATIDSCAAQHRVSAAAERLYAQEVALHYAHQSGVDAWIAAAADRLHEAIVAYLAEVAPSSCQPKPGPDGTAQ